MTTATQPDSRLKRIMTELQPNRLVPAVAAGLLTGSLTVVIAITFATLAFASKIDSHVGFAIGLALAGSAVGTIIIALTSSYPGTISNAQDSPAAILTLMVAALTTALDGSPDRVKFVTAVAAIILATVLTGAVMFVLGSARLGRLVRFIPYPVMGGFLAGTGFLLLLGGMNVMTGLTLSADMLGAHFAGGMPLRWIPGLVLAVLLVALSRRFKHPLLLPGMMVLAIVIFFVAMMLTGTTIEEASTMGLLVGPLPDGGMWQMPSLEEFTAVDWGLVFGQAAQIATMVLLSVLQLLLNASGIELSASCDMDLNKELRAAGLANMAGGLFGGLPGYQSLSVTLLGHWMRARSRVIGLVAGAVALAALLLGGQFLSVFPNALLGGFLLFLGLSLLIEWIVDAARRLPLPEYVLIVIILLVIAARGYLEGVMVGLFAAVILFLVQYSRQSVIKHVFTNDTYRSTVLRNADEEAVLRERGNETLILQLQGFIFFGTANSIFEVIQTRVHDHTLPKLRHVVLDFRRVTGLDTSALLSYSRMKQIAEKNNFALVVTQMVPFMQKRLAFVRSIDSTKTVVQIFSDLDYGLEWCENNTLSVALPTGGETHFPVDRMLVGHMGPDTAAIVASYLQRFEVAQGDYLVRQGDATSDLFFIESGRLSVQLELSDGQTMRVRTAMAGAVLGEIGFYLKTQRTASIVADDAAVVYSMSPQVLNQMCNEAPAAGAAFHNYLATILAERLSENTELLRDALD